MTSNLHTVLPGSIVAEQSFGPFLPEDLKRYAEASGDLNPLHLDRNFARQAGFDDVIVHGMLGMAVLGRLVSTSLPDHRLNLFSARFCSVIPTGQLINCAARMESCTANLATLALSAQDAQGKLLIEGRAVVSVLPSN